MNLRNDVLILLCIGLSCHGCEYGASGVQQCTLRNVPQIQHLGDIRSDNECRFVEIVSPHARRVCLVAKIATADEMALHMPFLSRCDNHPGANTLNDLIPDGLKMVGTREISFRETDPYWIGGVVSRENERHYSVYAGYSASLGLFYLEYRWTE